MESQSESKTHWLKQPLIKGLAVGLLSIVGIAFTLLITRGSQFCILTIASCSSRTGSSAGAELLSIGAAAAAAAVLVVVVEVPVIVAVGIAIVIGLISGQLF
ncbi:MAG: hypothetical protein KME27_26465 [Lyngbya sp. HA4199-MV5]|jgi:hypothetical protein|nr:hypothetical protein [Lyngbya sp. HA4199-MV5]